MIDGSDWATGTRPTPTPPLLQSHILASLHDVDLKDSEMRQTEQQLIA